MIDDPSIPLLKTNYNLFDTQPKLVYESRIVINMLISQQAAMQGQIKTLERELTKIKETKYQKGR